MARQLFLMRVGKLESVDSKSLKDKSKRKVQRMGLRLSELAPRLDRAIHLHSAAARETCHKALKAGGFTLKLANATGRDESLIDVVTALPDQAENVLLVADQEALQPLLALLDQFELATNARGKRLPPAAMIQLELRGEWRELRPENCHYRQTVFPATLPKRFPCLTGSEISHRDRPAYYYKQSAVIPCRMEEGQLKVLLISSSGGGKCGVPKGIAEPDMTPWDSAAKEAFEEGGVVGKVVPEPLGVYQFTKWGGICSVEVFPLWVTRELPDDEWEEAHRKRQWVGAEKAAEMVTIRALAAFILDLMQRSQRGAGHCTPPDPRPD